MPDTEEQRRWVHRFAEQCLKQPVAKMLLLSTRSLPAAPALAQAARDAGWSVHVWDETPPSPTGCRETRYAFARVGGCVQR